MEYTGGNDANDRGTAALCDSGDAIGGPYECVGAEVVVGNGSWLGEPAVAKGVVSQACVSVVT
jgi:hypothetical protein